MNLINAKTLWTCKKTIFIDYMDAIGMAESIPNPRFKQSNIFNNNNNLNNKTKLND